jgi:hypothetical protein
MVNALVRIVNCASQSVSSWRPRWTRHQDVEPSRVRGLGVVHRFNLILEQVFAGPLKEAERSAHMHCHEGDIITLRLGTTERAHFSQQLLDKRLWRKLTMRHK